MSEETVEVKKGDDWMQKKWRPAMGWMYMLVCILDMAIFPIMWSLVQVLTGNPITQWNPLTLQGAGLFHLAMGAVLGIAAWGRTQEKLGGAAANPAVTGTPAPAPTQPAPQPPQVMVPQQRVVMQTPTPRYEEDLYAPQGQIVMGYGGRPAPAATPQPLI